MTNVALIVEPLISRYVSLVLYARTRMHVETVTECQKLRY